MVALLSKCVSHASPPPPPPDLVLCVNLLAICFVTSFRVLIKASQSAGPSIDPGEMLLDSTACHLNFVLLSSFELGGPASFRPTSLFVYPITISLIWLQGY